MEALTKIIEVIGGSLNWAVVGSALAIIASVLISAWFQRRIHRQILTFENESKLLWDKDYQEARKIFIDCRDGEQSDLVKLAEKDSQSSKETSAVRTILNDYELVAIGLESKILDEKFLKGYYKTTLIADHKGMKEFIKRIRIVYKNDNFYKKFQMLAEKWEKE